MKIFQKILIIISLVIVGIFFSWYLIARYMITAELPSLPYSTIYLDRDGQEIGEVVYSGSIRHRAMRYDEIPDLYRRSLIALEDQHFSTHHGIDWMALGRAMITNLRAQRVVEGGSTIPSGLARQIRGVTQDRTIWSKVVEFSLALRLSQKYSKETILTEYVNRVEYGSMNYGLAAAASYYFGRSSPLLLTPAEQIALLILPRNPVSYHPFSQRSRFEGRYQEVVEKLSTRGIFSPEELALIGTGQLHWRKNQTPLLPFVVDFYESRKGERSITMDSSHPALTLALSQGEREPDSEVRKSVLDSGSPLPLGEGMGVRAGQEIRQGVENPARVRTTIDLPLSQEIEQIASSTLRSLAWRNVGDYGVLILDRVETAPELRVMIGGFSYQSREAGQVNSTLALRQPGSTIKPFTYLLAFRDLGLTPEDTILDLPVGYRTSEDYSYEPKNYSLDYQGQITLREALAQSVNIPAVKIAERVGVEKLLRFLQSVGITSLTESADHYGLGLTIGNAEMSLYEILQAYTIFAYQGKYCQIIVNGEFSIDNGSCTPLVDARYTDMIASILTDRYAKLRGFPIGSSLDFSDRTVFVKTGTSRNFRDNYAVGYTPRYMIAVWTGNKSGENMKGVSGATGAGEIFRRIISHLEPTEMTITPVTRETREGEYLSITSPIDGSVYQISDDDSRGRFALRYSTNISSDHHEWRQDGQIVSGDFLAPSLGGHTIELILSRAGREVSRDQIRYTGVE